MLIHIGYPKTATSWLQNAILRPCYGFTQLADHGEIDRWIVRPHGLCFDPEEPRRELAIRRLRAEPGQVPTLSSEILSGHPFYGGVGSDVIAERLAQVAPGSRILITIRAQTTMLPSVYLQYLQRGGTLSPPAFFAGTTTPGYRGFDPQYFEYHRLIALYQSLFEHVSVLTQESFVKDPITPLSQLRAFAGCKGRACFDAADLQARSVSPHEAMSPILRRLNHVRQTTLSPAPVLALTAEQGRLYRAVLALGRRLKWQHRPVSDYVAQNHLARFGPSNNETDRLTDGRLDLSAYPQVASSPFFQGSELATAAGPVRAL